MSAEELGENLAQLVWESFTDFLERRGHLSGNGDGAEDGAVLAMPTLEPEEALIFFMWLHTRSCQQACGGDIERGRQVLDAMHKAVYEDLEAASISRLQLPLFEQRVSARYAEYYDAASPKADEKVVEVAARHLLVNEFERPGIMLDLAEATTVTAGPLRDYLAEIMVEAPS